MNRCILTNEFNHLCFWKNESLKLKRTQHTAFEFSDYKHQLSVNSSVCLQEFKQCLSGQLQRKNNSDG